MSDKNVVTVEGNLTKAPVLIEKQGRKPVCLLRIACNRSRKNSTTGAWENHPRFFEVKVYGPKTTEVSTYAKGEKVLGEEGYLDWYEKGEGEERREYVSIVAANTPDGITRVPKPEEQAQAGTDPDDEIIATAKASSKTAGGDE
jgi:single-stranded DNA-binding protein